MQVRLLPETVLAQVVAVVAAEHDRRTVAQFEPFELVKDPPDLRTIRSRIPRDLEVICLKCLAKEPQRRYGSMGELAADLMRHLAKEPILAKPPGPLRRAAKWARRNPTKSAAGSIAAAAFVAISALAWQLQLKTDEANENAQQAERAAAGMAVEKQRAEEIAAQLVIEKQEVEIGRDEAERIAQFQGRMLGDLDAFDLGQAMLLGFEEGITKQLRAERGAALGSAHRSGVPSGRRDDEDDEHRQDGVEVQRDRRQEDRD